jgi:hypothetical protein
MSEVIPNAVDHRALESLLAQVLEALEGRTPEAPALWMRFDDALHAHFDQEERSLVADLVVASPREARVLLEEHRYLRGRLAQLRATLPAVPVDAARTFLDELHAHGANEERILYRCDESCPSMSSSTFKSSST